MSEIISAAAFLRRHVPCLNKLNTGRKTRETILMRLAWHCALKSLCVVKDMNGKIEAVGCARAIDKLTDARNTDYVNEHGGILLIENVASKTTEGMRNLLRFCKQRWPLCRFIMFHRSENGHKIKIYEMNTFLKKARVI